MKSLARSARRVQEDGGAFLPPVFLALEQAKIRLRSGTATFVAGPPGAMKTGLVLYWVLRLNKPTLFFSADCEPFEIVERSAAAMTGDTMEKVRVNPEAYGEILRENAGNVRFVYEDSPSYEDVEMEVAAYVEVYGAFPEIIVIDNLMNLVGEAEGEWAAHRDHARVIHKLTRITKAALVVLAHMSDDRADPTTPAPRSKLMGKIGALPKVILSLALRETSPGVWTLLVGPVKSRWGPADASGQTYATLFVDPSTNRFYNTRFDMERNVPA
jgi:hypothetical protein